jgi:hypothetical protein
MKIVDIGLRTAEFHRFDSRKSKIYNLKFEIRNPKSEVGYGNDKSQERIR